MAKHNLNSRILNAVIRYTTLTCDLEVYVLQVYMNVYLICRSNYRIRHPMHNPCSLICYNICLLEKLRCIYMCCVFVYIKDNSGKVYNSISKNIEDLNALTNLNCFYSYSYNYYYSTRFTSLKKIVIFEFLILEIRLFIIIIFSEKKNYSL